MFTKTFKQLSKSDVSIAGGKGASLGEMMRAGIPVPTGFVILVEAFDKFLAETDLVQEIASQLARINYKDINSVDRASNEIRDLFHDASMPEDLEKVILKEFKVLDAGYVAVRSSATAEDSSVASWAGELETYLNTTKETFFTNIKKCWSSLFTSRALFYAFEKGMVKIDHQQKIRAKTCLPAVALAKAGKKLVDCYPVSVAVAVQKMIQSEVAGICFTVHPVTEDRNQMVIEAGWGLGEAIVGGKITPDTYVMDKSKMTQGVILTPTLSRGKDLRRMSAPKSRIRRRFFVPLRGTQNDRFAILDKNISEQEMMIVRKGASGTEEVQVPKAKRGRQKLTDRQIFALAKICLKIENHYAAPQDIEWALEGDKFYITQSRPITTL